MKNATWRHLLWALLLPVLMCISVALAQETAEEITQRCKFYAPTGKKADLHDGNMRSYVYLRAGKDVRVMLPEGGAGYIRVEWSERSGAYRIEQYDENKQELARTSSSERFPALSQTFPLEENAKYVFIVAEEEQSIAELVIYSKGELPWNAMNWLAPYEDCDLMVISTHQDDEWLWFGGIIPYYERVQGKKVQLVYMANCGRKRYNEALNGLWCGGLTHYPELLGLKDERIDSFEESVNHWGGYDGVVRTLVECIRRYKPEVILTHDWNGEYGHNQHKITSRAMQYAIDAAADPTRYPDSFEKYGAWQVSKLYRHLESKCPIRFDWDVAYEQLNGHTPYEVACRAYDCHKSQHNAYQMQRGGRYDNEKFGLSWSNVGEDALHKDLFENIEPQSVEDLFASINAQGEIDTSSGFFAP